MLTVTDAFAVRFPDEAEAFARLVSADEDETLPVTGADHGAVDQVTHRLSGELREQVTALLARLADRVDFDGTPLRIPASDSDPARGEAAQENQRRLDRAMAASTADLVLTPRDVEWGKQTIRLAIRPWSSVAPIARPTTRPRILARARSSRRVVRARSHGPPGRSTSDDDPHDPPPDGLSEHGRGRLCPRCGTELAPAARRCETCYVNTLVAIERNRLERFLARGER